MEGRYYNLNEAIGHSRGEESPQAAWGKLESDILQERPDWVELLNDPASHDETWAHTIGRLVSTIERFIRALVRLFTIGELGDEARKNYGVIKEFLNKMDGDLGC